MPHRKAKAAPRKRKKPPASAKASAKIATKGVPVSYEGLKLDQQTCFALYTASRLVVQAYQPLLAPLKLTYPQYLTMLVLWEHDGLTVSEIGRRLRLDSGTLSPLLKKLEEKELLVRERTAADDRSFVLKLTADGQALRDRARGVPDALLLQPGTSKERLATMKRQLDELVAGIPVT